MSPGGWLALRLLSILAAAAPTALLVLLFWWIDRHEKEPKSLFLGAFVWGAIPAVILSIIVESWFAQPLVGLSAQFAPIVGSTLIAPPVEELAKGAALWGLYHGARAEFDGMLDGIVYGAVVGLGFAMVENVLYFWSALQDGGLSAWLAIVPTRTLAFGLNHAMFTAFTGIGFARARYIPSRAGQRRAILGGVALATGVHLAHNALSSAGLCLLSLIVDWAGVLVVLVMVALSWRREAEWMRDYLRQEVTLGVLSEPLYEAVITRGHRYRAMMRLWQREGVHKAQLFMRLAGNAAELAQKKHQLAQMGEESGNSAIIAQLRQRLLQARLLLGE
jgi:RsiW-degrading membrane proteinase PrsW (M82 family)